MATLPTATSCFQTVTEPRPEGVVAASEFATAFSGPLTCPQKAEAARYGSSTVAPALLTPSGSPVSTGTGAGSSPIFASSAYTISPTRKL